MEGILKADVEWQAHFKEPINHLEPIIDVDNMKGARPSWCRDEI